MSTDTADVLLAKLSSGDAAAAEQAFRAYEPYLRMVVRRQLSPRLRAKFDSLDIVQSVWADVWQGLQEAHWRFADMAQLRAFLVKVTRHRLLNRVRQHKRVLAREQALGGTDLERIAFSPEPRPSEIAQAEELKERLLALCAPAHREVLQLKQQGLPLAEIATRTGLHESSIRRILYDLARRLAREQRKEENTHA